MLSPLVEKLSGSNLVSHVWRAGPNKKVNQADVRIKEHST